MNAAAAPDAVLPPPAVRLGVSTCLLGRNVRMDGGHKRNRFLVDGLGPFVEWVPVCPEVEVGMGTPRPALRLERTDVADRPRMVVRDTGADVTREVEDWSEERIRDLAAENLHGYVFKKDSPSCGLFRVKLYQPSGMADRSGRGLFAAAFARAFPTLPIEEEGRLSDPKLRENFVLRVFTLARWRALLEAHATPGGLVLFHSAHKMLLLAHSPVRYRELGQLVAEAGSRPWGELTIAYEAGLMDALSRPASRARHVNALQHIGGVVKDSLDAGSKREWADVLQQYRAGLLPLVAPLTLLRHFLSHLDAKAWARDQVYLDPYPAELMLRNA